ncbi:MAG: hypothetical protein COB93_07860, partial [Sneathiella sp.]
AADQRVDGGAENKPDNEDKSPQTIIGSRRKKALEYATDTGDFADHEKDRGRNPDYNATD